MKGLLLGCKYFRKKLRVIIIGSLLSSCVVLQGIRAEEQVLPEMTVIAIKGDEGNIIQRSSVEWSESNDPSIVKEADGSYTVGATTNPYSLRSLMVSSGSPVVNVDLSYAQNSTSMSADGRSALQTLLESLSHFEEKVHIHLRPINTPYQADKAITQRRIDSLRAIFQNRGINLKIVSAKIVSQTSLQSKRLNHWRVQVQYQN